jgi:hypothetical protein
MKKDFFDSIDPEPTSTSYISGKSSEEKQTRLPFRQAIPF